jgi:hypothetical protein
MCTSLLRLHSLALCTLHPSMLIPPPACLLCLVCLVFVTHVTAGLRRVSSRRSAHTRATGPTHTPSSSSRSSRCSLLSCAAGRTTGAAAVAVCKDTAAAAAAVCKHTAAAAPAAVLVRLPPFSPSNLSSTILVLTPRLPPLSRPVCSASLEARASSTLLVWRR